MPRNRNRTHTRADLATPTAPDLLARYIAGANVAAVLDGYDAAAYGSSVAYAGEYEGPLDDYMAEHDTTPAPDLLAVFRRDVVVFLLTCARDGLDLSELGEGQIGHDIWLTRNGHGTGFWCRDADTYGTEEVRDALDSVAAAMGEHNIGVDTDTNTVVSEWDALDARDAAPGGA